MGTGPPPACYYIPMARNRLISLATAPVRAVKAVGKALDKATDGSEPARKLAKAQPAATDDRDMTRRLAENRVARAKLSGPAVRTPKGEARAANYRAGRDY
jgi:hypothetical protein